MKDPGTGNGTVRHTLEMLIRPKESSLGSWMLPKRADRWAYPIRQSSCYVGKKEAQRGAWIKCSPLSPLKQLSLSPDSANGTQSGNVSPALLSRPLRNRQLLGYDSCFLGSGKEGHGPRGWNKGKEGHAWHIWLGGKQQNLQAPRINLRKIKQNLHRENKQNFCKKKI